MHRISVFCVLGMGMAAGLWGCGGADPKPTAQKPPAENTSPTMEPAEPSHRGEGLGKPGSGLGKPANNPNKPSGGLGKPGGRPDKPNGGLGKPGNASRKPGGGALSKLPLQQLIKKLKSKKAQEKLAAMRALGERGSAADTDQTRKPLLSQLKSKNSELADAAEVCLTKIATKRPTIEGLYAVYDGGGGGGDRAYRVLMAIDSPAKSKVHLDRLQSGNKNKVRSTLYHVGKSKQVSKPLMDHLIALLEHEEEFTRGLAVRAIGGLGPQGAPATDKILERMEKETSGKNELLRLPYTLLAIAGREKLLQTTKVHLQSDKALLRDRGIVSVYALGPTTVPELAPHIAGLLSDSEWTLKAIRLLGDMGPGAKAAVPQLIPIAAQSKPYPQAFTPEADARRKLQSGAIRTLGKIGPDAAAAIDPLKQTLQTQKTLVGDVLPALADIMPPKEATPLVLEYLNSSGTKERTAAAVAIQRLGKHAKAAVPKLLEPEYIDGEPYYRSLMIVALGRAGADNPAAIAKLIQIAKEDDDDSSYAIQALAEIRPTQPKVVDALIHIMHNSKDWILQANTADYLSKMPEAKEKIVPELLKAWKKAKAEDFDELISTMERALLAVDPVTAGAAGIKPSE